MVKYYVGDRKIKTISQLKERLIKDLTKGNVFLYHDESNKQQLLDEAKIKAEMDAVNMIKDNFHIIPERIKRDVIL